VRLLSFWYIKDRLTGASFEGPDQLLQAIDAIDVIDVISQSIEKAALERAFQEWMDR
jgi:hypothetical protein